MNKNNLLLSSNEDIADYITDTYAMYFDSVDFVQKNKKESIILSSGDSTPYFNFILHKQGDINECVERNRNLFQRFSRDIIVYITPISPYYTDIKLNIKPISTSSFMFLENKTLLKSYISDKSLQIEICKDDDLFIKVFGDARKDPNNVYGVASDDMINGMRRFLQPVPDGLKSFAAMAWKDGIPVADVISVYNKKFLLVIGLGTIPQYRKQGIATQLMKDILQRAEKLNIQNITLQTAQNSYNEKLYEKMGFKTKFCGKYYKF